MTEKKLTPMMAQYQSIKDRYPDAVLFYRMGDFYEMFNEDAVKAAAILDIALTSRDKNQAVPTPMCGVPFKAADTYIARLIQDGCKVAVCEQVEDPSKVKGLVKREVVRVITPGMILNESLLDNRSNNFLLALAVSDGKAGLACLDISTGSFRVTETTAGPGRIPENLMDEVFRVDPSEILLPDPWRTDPIFNPLRRRLKNRQITWLTPGDFSPSRGRQALIERFNTRSLKGFGCDQFTAGIGAAGAVMTYVDDTQLQDTQHITAVTAYFLDDYLIVDDRSCRNLELLKNIQTQDRQGTLISILDRTATSMGGRTLRKWIRYPLKDRKLIELRLDAVEEATRNRDLRNALREHLKSVYDLERLGSKISMGHGNARDLTALKNSLLKLPDLFECLHDFSSPLYRGVHIKDREQVAADLTELADLIHRAIREDAPLLLNEGGMIRDGYSKELDELLDLSRNGKAWIAEKGVEEKEATGLSSLKIKYNKVFGYFIEVSKVQSAQVPEHYVRKQTLVNAERFITDELKTVESRVLSAQDRRCALEYDIFCQVREKVTQKTQAILTMADFLATVDCLLSLAQVAGQRQYTRPEINPDRVIRIRDGRHPVVEALMESERYVPNSIEMDMDSRQVLIITGPNMAGKSTVLRQVALCALMAQMGSFVPAGQASVCILDRIFTRVGALDNLSQGQSTFMVEMEETARIINNVTPDSLVILDEIGRGTSTFDGLSIAWAVAGHLHDHDNIGVKTLFATHYHELTRLAGILDRVKNFNIAVKEFKDHIIFLRKLVPGGTNKSYGIQVARLAGLPQSIIETAKTILGQVEAGRLPGMNETDPSIPDTAPPAGAVNSGSQLALFQDPRLERILSMIEGAEITAMTPIQALNFLNDIQEKLKSVDIETVC